MLTNLEFFTLVFGVSIAIRNVESNYHLSEDIFPVAYDLTIQPYLNAEDADKRFKFDGETYIDIKAKEVNEIVLHSKNLNYMRMEYWEKNDPYDIQNFKSSEIDNVTDKIHLELNEKLASDKVYTLHFVYVGQISEDMKGFFRSSYIDEKNSTKWIAYTHFEKNHARRVFPCFDEPKFKATFNLTIIRHKNLKSVSNTRILSTKNISENIFADTYGQTPIMSTYLLAFLVSEFNERGNEDFYIVARPEYYSQTNYSFEIGQKLLKEFNKYMPIAYHDMGIDKIHLAAVPQLAFNGMENWGLVMFKEKYLLFEPGVTMIFLKQRITEYISHELAHMWFGNLVTCERWGNLWLKEGFAKYFQYMMTAKVYSEWNMENQFVASTLQLALMEDATNKSHPLSVPDTNTLAEDKQLQTSIVYNKAALFIRMIRHAMGEEAFHHSLKDYLIEYKYKSTVPENLLKHFKNHWPITFKMYAEGVFKSFTEQVGYPVVSVIVSNDNNSMEISQKRFLLNPEDGSDSSLLYTIPFTYTTSNSIDFESTNPILYLEANANITKVDLPKVDWVMANIQRSGFYRVKYDSQTWFNIKSALMASNWSNIHPLNRAQYVDDLFNLAQAGEIRYDMVFECIEYLETETNVLPWSAAINGFEFLEKWLETSQIKLFAELIAKKTKNIFKHIGFEEKNDDTALEVKSREKILLWSCKHGNSECISESNKYFDAMNSTAVPNNIRFIVYCTAMREGNEMDFDRLLHKYKTETVYAEKNLILESLGCVKSNKLVEKYFNFITGKDILGILRYFAVLAACNSNQEFVSPFFKLIKTNFERVASDLNSYHAVANIIQTLANCFNSETQQKDLEDFINYNMDKLKEVEKRLRDTVTNVAEKLKAVPKHVKDFLKYFEELKTKINTVDFNLESSI